MAMSNSQPEQDEVEIVCSVLCAKLQAKNLSSGSCSWISLKGRIFVGIFTPCEFERHARHELLFAMVENLW